MYCDMNEFSVWIIYYILFCILLCFRVKVNSVHLTDHVLAEKKKKILTVYMKTFTFMHLADAFIQSNLHCIHAIHFFFVSMCVHWELYFALLTQCSTTEPQEHISLSLINVHVHRLFIVFTSDS